MIKDIKQVRILSSMIDVEKELDPLFDKLENQDKLKEVENLENMQRLQAKFNEFDAFVNREIFPVMRDYQIYLQKKDIIADITKPQSDLAILGNFSIEFKVNDAKKVSSSGDYPKVKFTLSEENIVVETDLATKTSETYTKNQINQDLVKGKLNHLIESCLS